MIVVGVIIMALFAEYIAPHDPLRGSLRERLLPPVWHEGGNWTFPLGTDSVGRDLLSRIIYGARITLVVAVPTLIIGAGVGSLIGMVSGYARGRFDAVAMRIADITIGFPVLLLALLLAVIAGPNAVNVIVAIVLVIWARFARVVRAEVLGLRTREYVTAARVTGCSSPRIIRVHIFPNVVNTIAVMASLQLGWVIVVEATLSFLGAGIPPPAPAWGSMAASGREFIVSAYWVPLVPGVAIMLVVLALNLLGDWLRDILDPKMSGL